MGDRDTRADVEAAYFSRFICVLLLLGGEGLLLRDAP